MENFMDENEKKKRKPVGAIVFISVCVIFLSAQLVSYFNYSGKYVCETMKTLGVYSYYKISGDSVYLATGYDTDGDGELSEGEWYGTSEGTIKIKGNTCVINIDDATFEGTYNRNKKYFIITTYSGTKLRYIKR
jgi:hypothetical protein